MHVLLLFIKHSILLSLRIFHWGVSITFRSSEHYGYRPCITELAKIACFLLIHVSDTQFVVHMWMHVVRRKNYWIALAALSCLLTFHFEGIDEIIIKIMRNFFSFQSDLEQLILILFFHYNQWCSIWYGSSEVSLSKLNP